MDEAWYVSIFKKNNIFNPQAKNLEEIFNESGFSAKIVAIQHYEIQAILQEAQITQICNELLFDPITELYLVNKSQIQYPFFEYDYSVFIKYKQGVMDATGLSVAQTLTLLGFDNQIVRTGISYLIKSDINLEKLAIIIKQSVVNELIQDFYIKRKDRTISYVKTMPILAYDEYELEVLSKDLMLALNKKEMVEIQRYFSKLRRDPNDIELETIAQTWSEHCIHKTFNGIIQYNNKKIDSLLRSFIMKATNKINAKWCINVFSDNAGIISFKDNYGLAIKVETHNHPTALDPYGGAGTGSGGVFRDSMGVGAKPIASTDCLFFGSLGIATKDLPRGGLHPKRLMKGSVAGIRDYGNKMGIPTINGCVGFHDHYLGNPLVFAGVIGLIPLDKYVKNPQIGDLIVLVGGKTGRDGVHGVTFASESLNSKSEIQASNAVQIGNPLEQKRVLDALIRARDTYDRPLYSAITDCGGGGLSSAVGEMGKNLGVEVELDKVPLKYEELLPWEIWVSESQERMILAVPSENIQELTKIFDLENCEISVIGKFTDSKKLILKFKGNAICDLDMNFLHNGIPKIERYAKSTQIKEKDFDIDEETDFSNILKKIIQHPTVASKEWIIRQYDHEVQANTILKPLQGENLDGHGDASVLKPLHDSWQGFIVSNGFNPNYSSNPRKMALSSIDEAIRNNICCGGRRFALLDNFSWGNPEKEESLGALVEACTACYESAVTLGTPFISGKDSLYNDFHTEEGITISIPHTLVITCVGLIPDVRTSVTSDFKQEGNYIYLVGTTKNELGGSLYYTIKNISDGIIPDVDLEHSKLIFDKMIESIDNGLVKSCHDCSEGGLMVALAEMCFGGNLGVEIYLRVNDSKLDKNYQVLFSESNSRFVVEVNDHKTFEKLLEDIPIQKLGKISGNRIIVKGITGERIIDEDVQTLKDIWKVTFDW